MSNTQESIRGWDAGAAPGRGAVGGWAVAGIPVGSRQLVRRKVASLRPVAVVIGSSLS